MPAMMTKSKNGQKAIAVAKVYHLMPEEPEERTNPFTGVSHTLEPLACCLYDFITRPDMGNLIDSGEITRSTWDNARYAFLDMWPDEYYDLID